MKQLSRNELRAVLGRPEVNQTWLDKAVAWVSPAAGHRRMEARRIMADVGGWEGGKRDKRSTRFWRPGETSARQLVADDLKDLRARARDLVRNVPLATGAVATTVTNVVGDGIALKPQPNRDRLGLTEEAADAWAKTTLEEWELFCERADFTGRLTFDEIQGLVLRSVLEAGDVFAVRRSRLRVGDTYGLKIQLIEAERVSNPNDGQDKPDMVSGVRLDGDGYPTGYSVRSGYADDGGMAGANKATWKTYTSIGFDGRPLIMHLYTMTRPDQPRGVPFLAPVIEAIRQLGRYSSAEIDAAVINSFFTVLLKPAVIEGDNDESLIGELLTDSTDNGPKEVKLGPGAFVELAPGEDVAFADPKRPNANFDGFTQAMMRQIGTALELPYEVLMKSFTSSYSASRAALEMAWQFFRMRRSWLAWKFCQPTYEMFLAEAVATGRIAAPGFFTDPLVRAAWSAADWVGPSRIQLDPQKEASADEIDLRIGVKTRDQIVTERTGGSWERKHEQLARERARRLEDDLEAETPDPNAMPEGGDSEEKPDAKQTDKE